MELVTKKRKRVGEDDHDHDQSCSGDRGYTVKYVVTRSVQTEEINFKCVVQELTGKDSSVATQKPIFNTVVYDVMDNSTPQALGSEDFAMPNDWNAFIDKLNIDQWLL